MERRRPPAGVRRDDQRDDARRGRAEGRRRRDAGAARGAAGAGQLTRRPPMHDLHGFLILDKPAGPTSFNVVARVRKVAGGRVGHAGRLDPFATGVLVVCVGNATRLAEYATAADKRYLAELTLGVETDTYDRTGQVVAERLVEVTREQLERALRGLRGTIEQRP